MISYLINSIPGKGKGLFAGEKIITGQLLFKIDMSHSDQYTPEELQRFIASNSEVNGDHANYAGHGMYVIEDTPAAFMNHSCEPNCRFKMHSILKYDVIALRSIMPDEELTHDYTACSIDQFDGSNTWELHCECGSRKCRGIVTGDYFTMPFYWQVQNYHDLPPSIKWKYREKFSAIKRISKIRIRRMEITDSNILARIHIDAWKEAYKAFVPPEYLTGLSYIKREEGFRNALKNGVDNTFVVAVQDKICGFIILGDCRDSDLENELAGEIWGIYLDPEKWGMKIGTFLCSWAETELASRGYIKIFLWVFLKNYDARKFYESNGFKLDGSEKTLNAGKKLIAIRYVKNLKKNRI